MAITQDLKLPSTEQLRQIGAKCIYCDCAVKQGSRFVDCKYDGTHRRNEDICSYFAPNSWAPGAFLRHWRALYNRLNPQAGR